MAHDDPYAGKTIGGDWAYDLSRATSYTPELTNTSGTPSVGADGTISGWYHRTGHLIVGNANFFFDGSGISGGSGVLRVSLPLDADTSLLIATASNSLASQIGSGHLRDSSTSANTSLVSVHLETATTVRLLRHETNSAVTDSAPIPWAAGDAIGINFAYVADSSVL